MGKRREPRNLAQSDQSQVSPEHLCGTYVKKEWGERGRECHGPLLGNSHSAWSTSRAHGNTNGKRRPGGAGRVCGETACAERNRVPIFLSYRRGQPEPQLNPSCISREILVQESLGWETESISQLCSLWEGVEGQGSLQRTHPAEEGTEIILLESLKRLEVARGGRGDSLGIEV